MRPYLLSKYIIVGIIGTLIDMLVLVLLVEVFACPILWAATIAFVFAATNNFIFNKWWTFKDDSKYIAHQYTKFLIVSVVGLLMTVTLMHVFVGVIGIWYIIAKALTSLLVLVWNFFANKQWTFKEHERVVFPKDFLYQYSIIIPAYNEARRIRKTLEAVYGYFAKLDHAVEVLVVDDGSRDDTVQMVLETCARLAAVQAEDKKHMDAAGVHSDSFVHGSCIQLARNYGKGRAVRTGVLKSRGRYVLYMDADGATPITEFDRLVPELEFHDVVIGSRKMGAEITAPQPWYRKLIGHVGHAMTVALAPGVRDTQCGFKLLKAEAAYELFNAMTVDRFGFDIELLMLAKRFEYKLAEVPVIWSHIGESNVRPFTDSVLTFKDVLSIYFNVWTGRYGKRVEKENRIPLSHV